jgi:hypothetical protein
MGKKAITNKGKKKMIELTKSNFKKLENKNDKLDFYFQVLINFMETKKLLGGCIPISMINKYLCKELLEIDIDIKIGEISHDNIMGIHVWNEYKKKQIDMTSYYNLAGLPYSTIYRNKALNNNCIIGDYSFSTLAELKKDYNLDPISIKLLKAIEKDDISKEIIEEIPYYKDFLFVLQESSNHIH